MLYCGIYSCVQLYIPNRDTVQTAVSAGKPILRNTYENRKNQKMAEESNADAEILCNGIKECTVQTRDLNNKRKNFLDWNDYFMSVAFLASMRSKDPCTQVGACIVDEDKKIVGVGYNGMPIGCNDDNFSWKKAHESELDSKFLYVCHAELNAILNKNSANVKNCTLYVGLFPCNECAKVIIQSGIKRVYYISDKHAHKVRTVAAKRMFDAAKVEYSQYKPKHDKIVIDFTEINWNDMTQLPPSPSKTN